MADLIEEARQIHRIFHIKNKLLGAESLRQRKKDEDNIKNKNDRKLEEGTFVKIILNKYIDVIELAWGPYWENIGQVLFLLQKKNEFNKVFIIMAI